MGQKVNPTGFRLAVRRNWESRWFATKRDFPAFILEDYRIREFLKEKLRQAAVPRIFIERAGPKVRVGANSSSLWPTIFSVTYTGTKALPL